MSPIVLNSAPSISFDAPIEIDEGLPQILQDAHRAAECHRRARYNLMNNIRVGMSLRDIVETVEAGVRAMLGEQRNFGAGFPVGVSMNDCAAHYSVNPGDEDIIFTENDVLKVDFGTHVNGRIMDSAFTVCYNPKFEPLLKAAQEATEVGLKAIGVDVRVCDIGRDIAEAMSGYEVELDGKTVPVQPIKNLNGHSIGEYKIHSGITIPLIDNGDTTRLTPNTFYACETFSTTGNGIVRDAPNCSHFMIDPQRRFPLKNAQTKKVLGTIQRKIGTLPFSVRDVDRHIEIKGGSHPYIKTLSSLGIIEPYPPLNDTKGSYVAQFEHTCYLTENSKIILTRGEDY